MSALEDLLLQAHANAVEVVQDLERVILAAKPVEESPDDSPGLNDPTMFWDYIRGQEGELFPTLRVSQQQGIERFLAYGAGKLPVSWMAYVLATVYHETGRLMQPVKEGFTVSDTWRKTNLRYYPYYGRGDVQLTWEENYRKVQEELKKFGLNLNLVDGPDQVLDPAISCMICVEGMLAGWFCEGKTLRRYLPAQPNRTHYKNARRIINIQDKADLIAGYAIEFEQGLRLGEWQ